MGGNGLIEPYNPLVDDHVLELARRNRGRDAPAGLLRPDGQRRFRRPMSPRFYAVFARRSEASHLDLFGRTVASSIVSCSTRTSSTSAAATPRTCSPSGGCTALDRILARAWDAGIVLAGTSAGANCWFETSTTDSFGPLAALNDGLGFLPGSHSPHYDGEPARRPLFRRLIGHGTLADGYASDDGAALVFRDRDLVDVVASLPGARSYRVVRGPAGEAIETELPTRYLG